MRSPAPGRIPRLPRMATDLAMAAVTVTLSTVPLGTLLYHGGLTLLLLASVWVCYRKGFASGMLRATAAGALLVLDAVLGMEVELEKVAAAASFMATAVVAGFLADRERSDLERLRRTSRALFKSRRRLETSYLATLQTLSAALDARDHYTAGHSERVATYAAEIGRALGLGGDALESLRRAARLHDIGKIGVRDAILLNRGDLSYTDAKEMQRHPLIALDLLEKLPFLRSSLPLITHHHERYDGSGYPHGSRGSEIPLGARIIAVADAFDAMTSERPYRPMLALDAALEVLRQQAATQFDPQVVEAFLDVHEKWRRRRGRGLLSVKASFAS